jgi:hypothetical protein
MDVPQAMTRDGDESTPMTTKERMACIEARPGGCWQSVEQERELVRVPANQVGERRLEYERHALDSAPVGERRETLR